MDIYSSATLLLSLRLILPNRICRSGEDMRRSCDDSTPDGCFLAYDSKKQTGRLIDDTSTDA
jgi:hypothetical protein